MIVLLPILLGLTMSPPLHNYDSYSTNEQDEAPSLRDGVSLSQDTKTGVMNPATMTQRGHQETGVVRARTDSGTNTQRNITIDEADGWGITKTKIDVTNVRKLYALNGSFDDEYEPWTNSTYDSSGGDQVQLANWNYTEGYVTAINYGELKTHPVLGDSYTHYYDSEILWTQTIVNSPQTDNFSLSFRFRYVTGPLDPQPYDLAGDVELRIYVHTDIYYMSLCELDARNVWYSITDFPIELVGAPVSFDLSIGYYFEYDDLVLEADGDYDGDGQEDGLVNAQKIELNLDDIGFASTTAVPFAEVDMTFHAGMFSDSVLGPTGGTGTSTLTNPDAWDVNPLQIQITTNETVSFDYLVTSYFERELNTSWTTDLSKHGVSYTADPGQSTELEFYTYVTMSSEYENLTMTIDLPWDWENTTLLDPLSNDVTGLCTVTLGHIYIPNGLFARVGWWRITHQSFNYAKNISLQVHDTLSESWSESLVYRSWNTTRSEVEIGTASVTPDSSSPVSISWLLPNGTIWASDSIAPIIGGQVTSSSWVFGGLNTTAGEWTLEIFWSNGTEIAYDVLYFDLYHKASLTAYYPLIEIDQSQPMSNLVYVVDLDTGKYLMDDSVTVTANWSTTTVTFTQNYAKNWWAGDFDTSLVGAGRFVVQVDMTRPYFDSASTTFTVITVFETVLDIVNTGTLPVENGLNEIFTAQLDFRLTNGTGISGATPTVAHSGPVEGLSWDSFTDNDDGTYSIDFVCNVSDTYSVTITLSKPYHYNTSDSFTLIIGETGSELEILNGTADVVLFGGNYRIVVEYRNSTGGGLSGADLQVVTVTPSGGLVYTNFTPITEGYYEITVTPSSAGTFSIVFSASILNHETQYVTFTLTASGVPTLLTPLPSSASISIDQSFTLQLWFQDESFNNISSALITAVNPPSGLFISSVVPVENGTGLYNVTLTPTLIGSYDLLFRASASNYQSSTTAFTLVVTEIQTSLAFGGDISAENADFAELYNLTVYFTRPDTGAFVADANITLIASDPDAVDWFRYNLTDQYVLTIVGKKLGTFSLSVVADKADHRISVKQFLFEVIEIETFVDGSGPLDALLVGRSYDFEFSFCFESNSSCILDADIGFSGSGAGWVTVEQLPSGNYSITLTPAELGDHSVLLEFGKLGFSSTTFRVSFRVERIPLTIIVNQGLSGFEGTVTSLVVTILEADTGDPVSGLEVSYEILKNGIGSGDLFALEETATAGAYSAQMIIPEVGGSYSIQIFVAGDHHIHAGEFVRVLTPQRSIGTMLIVTVRTYWWAFIGIGAVAIGLVARRRQRRKRIRENKIAMAVKKRFDGIKSLLGVIVLHKESGLPIYSRILREGLDETVISAFITAITSFRKEFDIEDDSEEWSLIPISDIVRVVATDKLFCAFITVGRPSEDYRERMINFAKTVGFIFDEPLSDIPLVVLDSHNKHQFDALFDDILDGALLRTYKLADDMHYKPKSCADERIARRAGETFKLEELASDISACGIEEGRVYKAIMEALEKHYLVSADEPSPYTSSLPVKVEPTESGV